jgi:hypothetical protein
LLPQFRCTLKLAILAAALLLGTAAQAQQKSPQSSPAPRPRRRVRATRSDDAKCKADATCAWIAALSDSKTDKQKRKAYCCTKLKAPAKKANDAGPGCRQKLRVAAAADQALGASAAATGVSGGAGAAGALWPVALDRGRPPAYRPAQNQ